MKKQLFVMAACGAALMGAGELKAQDATAVVVEETSLLPTETSTVECKDHYSPGSWRNNWYIQLGAGIRSPFVENAPTASTSHRRITAQYNLAVGRWFSPYLGFRFSGYYGSMHWNEGVTGHARTANLNVDFMWDMFNSCHGYNPDRVFSMIPYVGLGSTFVWRYRPADAGNYMDGGHHKRNNFMFPVSAGLQFRFRASEYVDFFAEGRAMLYGDNFNNQCYGRSMDIDISATGGIIIHFTGSKMKERYNPCDYMEALNQANAQVNDLRGALAATSAALAAAEAQLPCPEPEVAVAEEVQSTVVLPTVRFKLNSAYVSSEEMVNVYNIAEYMKANPDSKIVVRGYADKNTGSSAYNMRLSERRAQAVADILTGDYGISADRLVLEAAGSDIQPYATNDWNRIVIFALPL